MDDTMRIMEALVYFSILPVSIVMLTGWRRAVNAILGFLVGLIIIFIAYYTLMGIYELMLNF